MGKISKNCHFLDFSASSNINTINRYYQIFREKILASCEEKNGFEGELLIKAALQGNIIMGNEIVEVLWFKKGRIFVTFKRM